MHQATTPVRYVGAALAAALVVVLVVSLAPASAHTKKYRTTTSFGLTAAHDEGALGFVSSPKKKCVDNRKVKLYLVRKGKDKLIGVDRRTGRPKRDGKGYWSIDANLREGKRYRVKVVRKNIGKKGHRHICRGYKSRAYRW